MVLLRSLLRLQVGSYCGDFLTGSASALLGLLSFIFGGIAAPLTGFGGSDTAIPMGVVIAVADIGSILCYAILIRNRKAIKQRKAEFHEYEKNGI
jgi:hypothetical protein